MTFLQHFSSAPVREFLFNTGSRGLLTILAGLILISPLQGQSLSDSPAGVSAGVFGGPAITTLGPGLMAGIHVRNRGHQFTIRGVSTDLKPSGETWEIAGLYGRVITFRAFQLSAGSGVGVVSGTGYSRLFASGTREDLETMIGLPLEGRVTWKPVSQAGLSFYGFANVNTAQPLGGIALILHLSF